jgi:hypothetical protein
MDSSAESESRNMSAGRTNGLDRTNTLPALPNPSSHPHTSESCLAHEKDHRLQRNPSETGTKNHYTYASVLHRNRRHHVGTWNGTSRVWWLGRSHVALQPHL